MMIQLPEQHQEWLLKLHARYSLSTIVVDKNFRVFSRQIIEEVGAESTEIGAFCKPSHLMEIGANLENEAAIHGSFKIRISNGEIKTHKFNHF